MGSVPARRDRQRWRTVPELPESGLCPRPSHLREAEAMMRTKLFSTLSLRPEGNLLGPDSYRDQIAMKSSRRRRSKLVAQAAIVIAAAILARPGAVGASDISWSR